MSIELHRVKYVSFEKKTIKQNLAFYKIAEYYL